MKGGKRNKTLKRGGLLSSKQYYHYDGKRMDLQEIINDIKKKHDSLENVTRIDTIEERVNKLGTELKTRVEELEQKILSNTGNIKTASGGGRTKKYRKKIKKSNTIKN